VLGLGASCPKTLKNRSLKVPPPLLRSSSIFRKPWTISRTYILLGHFKDEPGIGGGGPVVGETIPERVARVVGVRGNEEGGGVDEREDRVDTGKNEMEERDEVVFIVGGDWGDDGIEKRLWMEDFVGNSRMTRGESLGRLCTGPLEPGSFLIVFTVGIKKYLYVNNFF